jgi:hypothetical protein
VKSIKQKPKRTVLTRNINLRSAPCFDNAKKYAPFENVYIVKSSNPLLKITLANTSKSVLYGSTKKLSKVSMNMIMPISEVFLR